jgi:GNAT superfamily N-acetyltransferase
MIYTKVDREDALQLIELGEELHKESRFATTGVYNKEMIWSLLGATLTRPEQLHISYAKDSNGKVIGFLLGAITIEYFTGNKVANDLGIFVHKEHRGSRVFLRLLKSFEDWAKSVKASKIILYHSTGIEPEKSKTLFEKTGYTSYGYLFDKEL